MEKGNIKIKCENTVLAVSTDSQEEKLCMNIELDLSGDSLKYSKRTIESVLDFCHECQKERSCNCTLSVKLNGWPIRM